MEYLFIYDDLRTTGGHPLHNYVRGLCDYLGAASVGGIMVDVNGRPGLLPSGDPQMRVEGELYRIHEGSSDALFDVLDRHEGCSEDDPEPREFFRHQLEVQKGSDPFLAWVYVYNGTPPSLA